MGRQWTIRSCAVGGGLGERGPVLQRSKSAGPVSDDFFPVPLIHSMRILPVPQIYKHACKEDLFLDESKISVESCDIFGDECLTKPDSCENATDFFDFGEMDSYSVSGFSSL
jgi:hypothetical protein